MRETSFPLTSSAWKYSSTPAGARKHAEPSSQAAVLSAWSQPVAGLQLSSVQTSLSLQFGAAPPTQTPAAQVSLVVRPDQFPLHQSRKKQHYVPRHHTFLSSAPVYERPEPSLKQEYILLLIRYPIR